MNKPQIRSTIKRLKRERSSGQISTIEYLQKIEALGNQEKEQILAYRKPKYTIYIIGAIIILYLFKKL